MSDPLVYRNFTQAQLNDAYNQATLVPDISDHQARQADETAKAREILPCRLGVPYGPKDAEYIDVYGEADGSRPAMIYTHGGAWRAGTADGAGSGAPAFVAKGCVYVVVNFSLAPDISLDEMVRQCRAATAYVYENAGELGIDPDRIFVSGHSSGGHLSAMVAGADWTGEFGLPSNLIKGLTSISGLYDLEPVRHSSRNEYLFLDEAAADRLSPMSVLDRMPPAVVTGWGGKELDEFQRQSTEFTAVLKASGRTVADNFFAGDNHFQMANRLHETGSPIFTATCEMMGLV